MSSQFSGCDVASTHMFYLHLHFAGLLSNKLTQIIFHLSTAPDLHRCGCGRFSVNVRILFRFFPFFRSFKGKCLKHTNSQGQELKPHYGLAPPFSPGVSA